MMPAIVVTHVTKSRKTADARYAIVVVVGARLVRRRRGGWDKSFATGSNLVPVAAPVPMWLQLCARRGLYNQNITAGLLETGRLSNHASL